jgi:hypothetical protein
MKNIILFLSLFTVGQLFPVVVQLPSTGIIQELFQEKHHTKVIESSVEKLGGKKMEAYAAAVAISGILNATARTIKIELDDLINSIKGLGEVIDVDDDEKVFEEALKRFRSAHDCPMEMLRSKRFDLGRAQQRAECSMIIEYILEHSSVVDFSGNKAGLDELRQLGIIWQDKSGGLAIFRRDGVAKYLAYRLSH